MGWGKAGSRLLEVCQNSSENAGSCHEDTHGPQSFAFIHSSFEEHLRLFIGSIILQWAWEAGTLPQAWTEHLGCWIIWQSRFLNFEPVPCNFHSGCINRHYHQGCRPSSTSSGPSNPCCLLLALITAIFIGLRWWLITVLTWPLIYPHWEMPAPIVAHRQDMFHLVMCFLPFRRLTFLFCWLIYFLHRQIFTWHNPNYFYLCCLILILIVLKEIITS